MSSFFGRFKPGTSPASPAPNAAPRRDPNAAQPTPLEKLLADAGPIRDDGSDKFFGFENFGSTCYCNSIIQSLYYSVPFREQVINFPARSPADTIERLSHEAALPRLNTDVSTIAKAQNSALSPAGRNSLSSPGAAPRKSITSPGGLPPTPGAKPEENKDSPEYKKKAALAAGPVLAMNYENSNAYGMSESLFTSLKDIFEAVIAHKSRIGVVSPNKFLEILRRENEMFRTPMHQDAHEFLNLLLNEVVENVEHFTKTRKTEVGEGNAAQQNGVTGGSTAVGSVNGSTNGINAGWVHELFEGTLTSETRCLTCENTSQRDEAFLDLSVDLEQHSSVTSCLRKFSEEEMLCERNKFHCDNCGGLQEAEKRMKIKRLPRILALHLKRFKYTEDLQRLQKLFHRVVYPYYLRLFNTTDDAEDPDRLYELYAVVVHIGGGPYHGHYVSIIKTKDRGWLLFDDEMVEPVDKAYVRNFFGGENVLACAYVLFYQETTLEAMQKEMEEEGQEPAAAAAAAAEQTVEVPLDPVSAAYAAHSTAHSKANGVVPIPNGHPLQHASTPSLDDDQFAKLNLAASAPTILGDPLTNTSQPIGNPLDNIVTALPTLQSPKLSPKKSTAGFNFKKSEKAREEKERKAAEKAAEKEAERQAKQKRKEAENMRRENYRRQEDELRAALAASKLTKAEDEKRRKGEEGTNSHGHDVGKEKDTKKENGLSKSSSLSRFKHGSIALRHKPTFWRHKEKEGEGGDHIPEHGHAAAAPGGGDDKPSKNRFSLGKKKSTFLH